MKTLIETLKNYKKTYIGKVYTETDLEDICAVIKAEEDGSDTDLHTCSISNDNGAWIKFYVDVNPTNGIIVDVDTTCVDYALDSEHDYVECVDVDSILN